MCLNKSQVQMIVACTHAYLLNTSAMEFLIWVPLISMQGTIVKGTPQLYGSTKKRRTIWPISENEVTRTVASKFGGPHIAKEYAPNTSNYPTPRPQNQILDS
ncbi:hypothetical protein H5410_024650 [Solanum commersonii]|uniref:Uncharacterized protein n=1 Tax=Solanum commersonii TaxID=4109 RepID=A0A9J5ZMI6_SOLCO|nr:hypothetical protein H5410_024650 [Solanum commersonii]